MTSKSTLPSTASLQFVDRLYADWLEDPSSVDPSYHAYFRELVQEDGSKEDMRQAVEGPSFEPRSIFNPPGEGESVLPSTLDIASLPTIHPEDLRRRIEGLSGLRVFRNLPRAEVELVARIAEEEIYEDGQYLFRLGDLGETLFLILEGHLLVESSGELLASLGRGEVVGEMAVFESEPRSADVKARGLTRVLRLEGDLFMTLVESRPRLTRELLRMLSYRIRRRSSKQDKVNQLIHRYRVRGHLKAQLDPLNENFIPRVPGLELESYGLTESDQDCLFSSTTIAGRTTRTLREIITLMEATYCGSIGVQYMHIDDPEPKQWIQNHMEEARYRDHISRNEQLRILTKLTDAEILEQFLHRKFLGQKRFSLEGAESLIPLLDLAIEKAGEQGMQEVVIGMAHRGRLNTLVNILHKSPHLLFSEFADDDPEALIGKGDVKYHLGFSSPHTTSKGQNIDLSMCFNPSHLEFVGPVVMGRVRAKQDRFDDAQHQKVLGIVIHGDAAFAGEGVVQECLNLSGLPGYSTGGILHLIVNNQIGFTTDPHSSRSSRYATEVARMLQTPIFHVNGEDPEAVSRVVRLALDYRTEFSTDVVVDMYCFRRHGHNEGDEPAYTQPILYQKIKGRKSVREGYLDHLLLMGEIDRSDADEIAGRRQKELDKELAKSQEKVVRGPRSGEIIWKRYRGGLDSKSPGRISPVSQGQLGALMTRLTEVPSSFNLNRKLRRFLDRRAEMGRGERPMDWGAAEALAFASLLVEGEPVRLTGQDSERGTFSHRHAVLHDMENGTVYTPLKNLARDQAALDLWNSPLSEIAVLGFEYGYSLDRPEGLTIWEAQFGDFLNVAQVIVDQFITSSEDKWQRLSGLTLLLPHGFEGQGPEHSSARLERFLNLTAEDNIQVVNPTTPAQFYHCLRRQALRGWRKPLVVMSPKSLLRHPRCISSLEDLSEGSFERIIADNRSIKTPRRILICSGKIYFELEAHREAAGIEDVAILRLEQYYPLDTSLMKSLLSVYPSGTEVFWVQEEPLNMGAWSFLKLRFGGELFGQWPLSCVTRPESASPATGSHAAHEREQERLIEEAFAG